MFSYPKLNFPHFTLRVKRTDGGLSVWDRVRTKWLVLTPEEWVRQHFLMWLTDHCSVPSVLIVTEHQVMLNGQPQRADIVVYDTKNKPYILIECKAAEVSIDETVFAQAARYNAVIGARYILISNGINHRCYELTEDAQYVPTPKMPDFKL